MIAAAIAASSARENKQRKIILSRQQKITPHIKEKEPL